MTAANRKFRQLSRQVQGWKARDAQRDKDSLVNAKYPSCRSTFTDCPPEDEFKAAVEKDKSNPPERCKKCSIFTESKFFKPVIDASRVALWQKLQETKE